MAREIRFRAWNKTENWFERRIIRINLNGEILVADDYCGACDQFKFSTTEDEIILMRYTGLKDKNGKEIYEGDVCDDTRGFRFVVIWDDANARFLGRGIGKQKEYIRYVGQGPAVEVIGNIYENPELLSKP